MFNKSGQIPDTIPATLYQPRTELCYLLGYRQVTIEESYVNPNDTKDAKAKEDGPKDLQQANENIRKAEGDEPAPPADTRKSGNRPAFDRDR